MIEPNGVQVEGRDMVNNPSHYNVCNIECIDLISYIGRNTTISPIEMYYLGNVIKYIYRAGKKGSAEEDYRKAEFYWSKLKQEGALL